MALADASLKPDEDPTDEKSIALYRFDLGRLEIGKSYEHSAAAPLLTGTASQQSISADTPGGIPFNVLAIVIESEEPGLVLEALSTAYGSKKGDLENAITDILKEAIVSDEPQS
jgi:hypothetical protein